MNWPLIITAAKDVVLGLAAAVTASVAVVGLKRWRRELRGKADSEAARALSRVTYNLRDQIALCRSPFILASLCTEHGHFHLHPLAEGREALGVAVGQVVRAEQAIAAGRPKTGSG